MVHSSKASKPSKNEMGSVGVLPFGKAVFGLQQDLIRTFERQSRLWLERMQVDVALWTGLAGYLASSKSAADILKAYTDRIAKQCRMTAEDSRHIFNDLQEISRKFARAEVEKIAAPIVRRPKRRMI